MINIFFICTKWCKSCPIIYNKIVPFVEQLDKSLYNFIKIDMDSAESIKLLENLDITITKLPSLIVNLEESEKCEVYSNEDIIQYFECIYLDDVFK